MRIINLNTNNIFDLPKSEAEDLLETSPDIFAKVTKNKRIIKPKKVCSDDNNVLKKISDD